MSSFTADANHYRRSSDAYGSFYAGGAAALSPRVTPRGGIYLEKTGAGHHWKTRTVSEIRLVLLASDCPDKNDFKDCLAPNVLVAEYNVETATADTIVRAIHAAVKHNGNQPFASAAFACHGGLPWRISKAVVVEDAATIGEDAMSVMKALGSATAPGGRVDLFACSLLATAEGKAVFDAIQVRACLPACEDQTPRGCAPRAPWWAPAQPSSRSPQRARRWRPTRTLRPRTT